jgi:hypothetical protein
MINFSRAFDHAWERMLVILFRPFDIGKWLVIGFSAFLAGLLEGGNGLNSFNFPSNTENNFKRTTWIEPHALFPTPATGTAHVLVLSPWAQTTFPSLSPSQATSWALTSMTTGLGIFFFSLVFIIVFAIVFLMYWLGARGQFLLLDNIVRNRAEIAWPWRTYARQGNGLFLFLLLWCLAVFIVLVPVCVVDFFVAQPFARAHRWPEGGEIPLVILAGLVTFVIVLAWGVFFFLFRELGVPLIFRNGITSWEACLETWRLTKHHPGSLTLFVLLRIALFLGLVIFQVVVCCFSCCTELLPYVGTVLLLPALIYIRCFTLDYLAQFGPEYDVWTVDLPPGAPPLPGPIASPPPPPG